MKRKWLKSSTDAQITAFNHLSSVKGMLPVKVLCSSFVIDAPWADFPCYWVKEDRQTKMLDSHP